MGNDKSIDKGSTADSKQKNAMTPAEVNTKNVPVIDLDKEEKLDTHILDVYKCTKCNHAFEKINLFVKHFIKAHKDVVNANRNSKSFSFSNFWIKMKVKASSSKKSSEISEIKSSNEGDASEMSHDKSYNTLEQTATTSEVGLQKPSETRLHITGINEDEF